jgi:hypothetical protein
MIMEPVHFNTGFIFRFGNDGIMNFGGEEDGMIDIDVVTWKESDISIAQSSLNQLRIAQKLPNIDLSSYDKTRTGTEKLVTELVLLGGIPNSYLLGCAICHQLQYRIPLEATFMTGQPNSSYNSDSETYNNGYSYFE